MKTKFPSLGRKTNRLLSWGRIEEEESLISSLLETCATNDPNGPGSIIWNFVPVIIGAPVFGALNIASLSRVSKWTAVLSIRRDISSRTFRVKIVGIMELTRVWNGLKKKDAVCRAYRLWIFLWIVRGPWSEELLKTRIPSFQGHEVEESTAECAVCCNILRI